MPPEPSSPAPLPPDIPALSGVPEDAERTSLAIVPRLACCVALNMLGIIAMHHTGMPLFLDMVGVALAAIAFGPWWGVAVALATHGAALVFYPPTSLLFTGVSVTGALVWGYGWRVLHAANSPVRQILLHIACGIACSAVATPVLVIHFEGFAGHSVGLLGGALFSADGQSWITYAGRNLTASIPDKLLSGLIATALVPVVLAGSRSLSPPEARATELPRAIGDQMRANMRQ
ncbi:MAG: hypothetical protein Q4G40_07360 [Brachybacterium sp.]|nr:hypothetical protein [Brachybacterium sp.]